MAVNCVNGERNKESMILFYPYSRSLRASLESLVYSHIVFQNEFHLICQLPTHKIYRHCGSDSGNRRVCSRGHPWAEGGSGWASNVLQP